MGEILNRPPKEEISTLSENGSENLDTNEARVSDEKIVAEKIRKLSENNDSLKSLIAALEARDNTDVEEKLKAELSK